MKRIQRRALALGVTVVSLTGSTSAFAQTESQRSVEAPQQEAQVPSPEGSPNVLLTEASSPEADDDIEVEAEERRELERKMAQLQASLEETQVLLKALEKREQSQPEPEPEAPYDGPLKRHNWYVGGTAGVAYSGKDNVESLFGTVDEGDRFSVSISGIFGRVLIERTFALGMVVRYDREQKENTLFGTDGTNSDLHTIEYGLTVGPAARAYLQVTGPLYVYAQGSLAFGYGERVYRDFEATTSTVQSANSYKFSVTAQPGIMVAAGSSFAIEMGVDLLGLDYSHYKVITDYEEVGKEDHANFNLNVNLLSLQFALVGYF